MFKYVLTTAAAIAVSAPAFAGGLAAPVETPVVAAPVVPVAQPSTGWTGAYGGVHLGYGDVLVTTDRGGGTIATDAEGDGTIYGVHAGYMHDFGNIVVGGELAWTDLSGIDLTNNNEAESALSAKMRLGYDMGSILPYAVAGMARVSASNSGNSVSDNFTLLGIGADYAVNDNWRIGVEYNHLDSDSFPTSGNNLEEATVDLVTLRVSFSF